MGGGVGVEAFGGPGAGEVFGLSTAFSARFGGEAVGVSSLSFNSESASPSDSSCSRVEELEEPDGA